MARSAGALGVAAGGCGLGGGTVPPSWAVTVAGAARRRVAAVAAIAADVAGRSLIGGAEGSTADQCRRRPRSRNTSSRFSERQASVVVLTLPAMTAATAQPPARPGFNPAELFEPDRRDWLRLLGGVLLAAGCIVLYVRKFQPWADFPLFLVVLVPFVVLYGLGWLGGLRDRAAVGAGAGAGPRAGAVAPAGERPGATA